MKAPKINFYKDSKLRRKLNVNFIYFKSLTKKLKIATELYKKLFWLKARVLYTANNWIYTTNHKRIAINYFLFTLFSGTCGMALATIIRLEMAYPGVGILAGDSLQYLAIVTAHAVIMVFFMIMPLLFGAYSNFLLPTQLGVHDVAFPRLNSAAFWFLPAGLIMLAQLVCLDRRYQRMNCFNMRELQALLKEKYYSELITNYETRAYFTNSLYVRHKLGNLTPVDNNMLLFVTNNVKINYFNKIQHLTSFYDENTQVLQSMNYSIARGFANLKFNNFYSTSLSELCVDMTNLSTSLTCTNFRFLTMLSYAFIEDILKATSIIKESVSTWYFLKPRVLGFNSISSLYAYVLHVWQVVSCNIPTSLTATLPTLNHLVLKSSRNNNHVVELDSNTSALVNKTNLINTLIGETTEELRAVRFTNPIFRYDYKLGNYLPKELILGFPNLLVSQMSVTGGIRKSAWFFSEHFNELFKNSWQNYLNSFVDFNTNNEVEVRQIGSMSGFYSLFLTVTDDRNLTSPHWVVNNTLNQKFHKIFLTSSMQQRVYENWRQLKFSREAWRCKLLAARHQKTLYSRYLNEDGVFWSVERNAKDVLPGWAMITPFSARTRFTAIGKVDIGLMGVFLVLNSSIVSSANFLITYRYLSTLNNRKRRDARAFFTEGILVASWMMIAANPMLAIGILMLLSDRHWQTSFFDYSGGGDTVLFQHMFWFFGHPEVYVIMIPTFGFTNTILSFYLRKRVSARASLVYSMYTIAFLGFFVWGHHMYMVGLAHTTRMLFSTLTVMISVPAATKLMHWCVTIVNSSIQFELPLLYSFLFIFFFVSGGISGMAVAHTGMDILFHDTFYVVGHFHVMLAGAAMLGSFAGIYFYFPAIFGVKYSRLYAYLHLVYYLLGQLMTVIPMFWLGYSGMPRRVLDYPAALGGWHSVASAGHLLSVAGMLAFFIMLFDSMRQGRAATRNSFGVSRFNTRLNFYSYEISKTFWIQDKGVFISRANGAIYTRKRRLHLVNKELLSAPVFSYTNVC
jgi:heme/copper-type cytochrome/quinol oxidase subunit 1